MSSNQPPENPTPPPSPTPLPNEPQTPPPAAGFASSGQPQAPDGPPGAAGYPPAGGGFAPQPPAPKKKAGVAKRLLITLVAAVVAIVVGILVRSGMFDSPAMKVGDCVQEAGEDKVKVVACDSADAQYSVLGIVEKQSQISARMGACKEFPETTSVYWEGRNTSTGTVYCLKKL